MSCKRLTDYVCFFATAALILHFGCVASVYALSNTDYERYKTSSSDFAKADTELNSLWRTLKDKLPAWEYEQLLKEQRDWLDKGYDAEASMYLIGMPAPEAYALAVNSRVEHLKRRFSSILRDSGEIPDTPSSPNTLPAASRRADVSGASSNEDAKPTSRPSSPLTIPSQHGDQRSGGAAQLQQQQENDIISVSAEGSGTTRYEALRMAWNEAVRKGVGMYLSSKTQIIDAKIIEEIASYSRGQIDSFVIISEKINQKIWSVAINAKIKKDIIEEFAAAQTEHRIGLSEDEVAKMQVEQDKEESQANILDINKNLFDFSKLLRYKASLEKYKINGNLKFFVQHVIMIDTDKFNKNISTLSTLLNSITNKAVRFNHDPYYKHKRDVLYQSLDSGSADIILKKINDRDLKHMMSTGKYEFFSSQYSNLPFGDHSPLYSTQFKKSNFNFSYVLPIASSRFDTSFYVLSPKIDIKHYINIYDIEFYYKIMGALSDKSYSIRICPGWISDIHYSNENFNVIRGTIVPMITVKLGFDRSSLVPFLVFFQEVKDCDPSRLGDIQAGYELKKID